ncbi:hypothetical protein ACMD2_13658 [Ananas comosus]|uniref:Uncharacterized protein n=1 Tax=Ananas comosus TaxID=4615 RepID=A0A199UPI5_ANACO|nr:hypothetical protein ACMD2_13658 [Ananas comosus]
MACELSNPIILRLEVPQRRSSWSGRPRCYPASCSNQSSRHFGEICGYSNLIAMKITGASCFAPDRHICLKKNSNRGENLCINICPNRTSIKLCKRQYFPVEPVLLDNEREKKGIK